MGRLNRAPRSVVKWSCEDFVACYFPFLWWRCDEGSSVRGVCEGLREVFIWCKRFGFFVLIVFEVKNKLFSWQRNLMSSSEITFSNNIIIKPVINMRFQKQT